MKKLNRTPLTVAIGSAVLVSGSALANSAENPFALTELTSGYQLAAAPKQHSNDKPCEGGCASCVSPSEKAKPAAETKKTEGSCGEGMCGAMMQGGKMKPGMESACGAMMKGKEGACGMMGGNMGGMDHGSQQGGSMDHGAQQGGGMQGMNHGDSKAGNKGAAEMSCGAMMHGGKEGSCGAMMKSGEGSCGSKK